MHLANDFINRVKGERTITYFDGDDGNEINIIINNIEIVHNPWALIGHPFQTQLFHMKVA